MEEAGRHRLLGGEEAGYNTSEMIVEVAENYTNGEIKDLALRADCGTGKSQVVEAALANYKRFALNLSSRRSLVREASSKYGLNHYENLDNDKFKYEHLMDNGMSICVDSLDNLAGIFPQWEPELVVMDEIDSTLKHVNRSHTEVSKKRSKIRSLIAGYIKKAKAVISLSHDLTSAEVNLVTRLRGQAPDVINVAEKVPPRPLTIHECDKRTFIERIFKNIVLQDDSRAMPAAHVIVTDEKKATRIIGAMIAGEDTVIKEQGEKKEIDFHDTIMATLPSELFYMRDRIKLLIVNSDTVKAPGVMAFLTDPTKYTHGIAKSGKTLIVVASPSLAEGVSVLPHEGCTYVYQALFSDRLSKEQVCQQVQRFRGATETHLWMMPNLRGERILPVYTLEEMARSKKGIEEYAKNDPDLVVATLKYLRYLDIKEDIYNHTWIRPEDMTDEERGAAVEKLLHKLKHRWIREDIITALFCPKMDPWLEYDLIIMQREQLDRCNYSRAIVNGLLAQGYYLTDYTGSIDKTDNKSYLKVKILVRETDTCWFQNGLNDPKGYGEYDDIKEDLAHSENLNERSVLELRGAKLGHEFSGIQFSTEQAKKEMLGRGMTYAAMQRAIAASAVLGTDRKRKRLAREIADEYREYHSLVDNHGANERVVRHQFLNKIGFWAVLDTDAIRNGYTRESKELELLVKAANKPAVKKMAKSLRISIPRVGCRKKYLRFFGTLLRWAGLHRQSKKLRQQVISKFPEEHDQQEVPDNVVMLCGDPIPTVDCYQVAGLDEFEILVQAHTDFLFKRLEQQESKIQAARDIYALVKKAENRNADNISKTCKSRSLVSPAPQAFQAEQGCEKTVVASAPVGAPQSWAIGAALQVTTVASRLCGQLVELVEWCYHENFAIWSIRVKTQAGEYTTLDYTQVALAPII